MRKFVSALKTSLRELESLEKKAGEHLKNADLSRPTAVLKFYNDYLFPAISNVYEKIEALSQFKDGNAMSKGHANKAKQALELVVHHMQESLEAIEENLIDKGQISPKEKIQFKPLDF